MNVKSFSYWWPRVMIVAFCGVFINVGFASIYFLVDFFVNPPPMPAVINPQPLDIPTVIAGLIVILCWVSSGPAAIIFFGWHLMDVCRKTAFDVIDEINNCDFISCWGALPLQLH